MRKSAAMSTDRQKSFYEDLSFLQELIEEAKSRSAKKKDAAGGDTQGTGETSTPATTAKPSVTSSVAVSRLRPCEGVAASKSHDNQEIGVLLGAVAANPVPGSSSEPNLSSPGSDDKVMLGGSGGGPALVHQKSAEGEGAWSSGPESSGHGDNFGQTLGFLRSPSKKRHIVSWARFTLNCER